MPDPINPAPPEWILKLLNPISSSAPVGALPPEIDDPISLIAPKELQAIENGRTVISYEEPAWDSVATSALDLLRTSCKHLALATVYTVAAMQKDGLDGLVRGLQLTTELVSACWERLDPPLDNDSAALRIWILESLSRGPELLQDEPYQMVARLQQIKILAAPGFGALSYAELVGAKGGAATPRSAGMTVLKPEEAQEALKSADAAGVTKTRASLGLAKQAAKRLVTVVEERTSEQKRSKPNLELLIEMLTKMDAMLAACAGQTQSADPAGEGQGVTPAGGGTNPVSPGFSGVPQTRDQAIKAIQLATDYFKTAERSSPAIPLLELAQEVVALDFLESIKRLPPGSVDQIITIFKKPA
jgi:type VI secretion system protein ImpA